jgi:hypothetical protein
MLLGKFSICNPKLVADRFVLERMSGSVVKRVCIYTYLQEILIKILPQNIEYLA